MYAHIALRFIIPYLVLIVIPYLVPIVIPYLIPIVIPTMHELFHSFMLLLPHTISTGNMVLSIKE